MMKRKSIAFLVALIAVFSGLTLAFAGDLPDLKFEKYILPNGLNVILHEDHSVPVASVNIWYHVGSKNEKPGKTGFAHIFEHMMFQQSEHHQAYFADAVEKIGGNKNGGTSVDKTVYWDEVPSNYLEKILWLEADRMGYLLPAVDQEHLNIQKDVIKNERRESYDNQPYGKAQELMLSLLYPPGHPYSWPIIGSMQDIGSASIDDVSEFFKTYYAPNNASLCIAGDFDPVQVKSWVEKYFGPIPPGPVIDRPKNWLPELNSVKRIEAEDNVKLARLYIAWPTPASYAPGDAEFDLLASILTNGKSSRLYKSLVYDKKLAQDVNAYQYSKELGSDFNIVVTAREGVSLDELEKEVDRILNDVITNGVTADEFARSRTKWETDFVRQLERLGGFGGRANTLNAYNTMLGDPGKLKWDRDRYTNATAEGMRQYAARYLKLDSRAILRITPRQKLEASEIKTDMAVEPGPAAEPSFTPPTIQKATLSNGMELYLVEDHKLPLVQVNLLLKSGWAADPSDRFGAGALTAELLNEGTKTRNALAISDEAQRLGAELSTGSSFDRSNVSLNVQKKNLEPALNLMADLVLNATFPQDELDRQKENYLGRIMQESRQPIQTAYKIFGRELYGASHPYGQPYTGSGTNQTIKAITRDDLLNFYRANYLPNNCAAIVVGDMTLDEARNQLEKSFKNWKPGDVVKHDIQPVKSLDKTKICLIDKPGAPQSVIFVGNLVPPRNNPDYDAAQVINQALGRSTVARLFMNLRQDKGYTYGSYSFFTSRLGQGLLAGYAQVKSEVTKESLYELIKEFREITADRPVAGTELADCRATLIKGFPQGFISIGDIAGGISDLVSYNLPLDSWRSFESKISSVSEEIAGRVAGEYIHPEALLIVIVGDRAKIEPGLKELNLGEIVTADAEI
ncbi:Peptidase M16 domain protein [Candidatus Zixiibacteriota bacterium]|nr:Peptidase M16 domain protein [candidate division Zixibacteria bacterium]